MIEDTTPLPILDTHQHLWDLDRLRLPWIEKGSVLDRSFLMEEYLREAEGLNIVKTIYMEVAVNRAQRGEEAEYVLELCARSDNPMVGAVMGGDPGAPEFGEFVRRYRDNPHFKGVRGGFQRAGDGPSPDAIRDVRLLGELGMRFDLGAGPPFAAAIRLVEACPETCFILNHCGNPRVQDEDHEPWRRELAEIAKRPNVVCKVSGIIASARPGAWGPADLEPLVLHVLREFGPDRVIFASDWPVCTQVASLAEWVNALKWIVRNEPLDERRKLFHDNAVALYAVP